MSKFTVHKRIGRRGVLTLLAVGAIAALTAGSALAFSPGGSPTISSDLPDYNPGQTVNLSGGNWDPDAGTQVHIVVNDSAGQVWQHTADVSPGSDGTVSDTFSLPTVFVANYNVSATQETGSGTLSATSSFTDANASADLDQCANDPVPSPNTDGCDSNKNQWVNGNVNSSKANYLEGDSLPYRMVFGNLSTSGSHNVTIEWDTTKAGKHALDYLTTYNRTVLDANPCLGVSGCSGSGTPFAIPADPQVTGAGVTPVAGNFTMFGGTITSVSAYAGGGSFPSGDNSRSITINFTTTVANPVLAWAGHIATRQNWGQGAAAISGSPYHTRLLGIDGATQDPSDPGQGGNQDRALSADAVTFPGSITIIKDATPNGSTSFGFTASPTPLTNFSLVDDGSSANTKAFNNIINFQTYTVNESSIPGGWGFDSASCSVTSPNGGSSTAGLTTTINMEEGENWTCTYNNSLRTGTLTVIKHVVNDNGGTKTASDFTMHVKSGTTDVTGSPAAGSETGTSYTLNGGSYNVSENTPPTGYTQTSITGDCDVSGNVTVVAGQNKTCTITNDDNAPALHLRKVVVNDNGGTAAAIDWTLTGNGGAAGSLSGFTPVDSGATFKAGTYALSESGPSGYSASSWVCVGGTQSGANITVGLGQSATCTITNDDNAPALHLRKVVVNDNGGTAAAIDWTLTGNGGAAGSLSGFTPVDSGATFKAGTYALSESGPSGYSASSWVCVGGTQSGANITVGLGQSATCTITNDDVAPKLHLRKVVVNNNGGLALDTSWTLTADGADSNDLSGTTPVDSGAGLQADTFALSESGPSGYSASDWNCVGGTQSGANITVGIGGEATCTITNNDIAPKLHLRKIVVNDNGGTATVADFTLTANGTGANDLNGASPVDSDGTLQADTWALSESTSATGYTASAWSCVGGTQNGSNISVGIGGEATCTITNDDNAPKLIVIKHVINDNGGTKNAGDFQMSVTGNSASPSSFAGEESPGTDVSIKVGAYSVDEGTHDGYTKSLSTDCTGTIMLGETKTCTITNDDDAPGLHLRKVVVNDNGGTATVANFTLTANGTGTNDLSGTSPVDSGPGLNADTFALSESTVAGYTASSWVCVGGTQSGSNITVGLGESATCTITNNDVAPQLHLRKVVVNNNGGTKTVADFTLTANGTGTNDLSGTSPVDSGPGLQADTWALSESNVTGYSASSWYCTGGTQSGSNITVGIGGSATCTITNNDIAPQLHLRKVVVNNNGGTKTVADFPLAADGAGTNDLSGTSPVDSGSGLQADTWALSETTAAGYTASNWVCVGGTQSGSNITVGIGGSATCTITNDDIAPQLHLRKVVVNDNGGIKTVADFTLTANGAGTNDLSGTSPVDSGSGLQADTWALSETNVYGYTAGAWVCVGGTQSGSNITVGIGGSATCTITNNDQPGTIIVQKLIKPTGSLTSFSFNTTGTGYTTFALQGGQSNSQTLNAGSYSVKELVPLGWTLTGIGGSTDANTPYNCTVTGSGGSTGVGDLNTQTASVTLKNGDTVTCVFENTGQGVTRTQGFWATHSQLASIAWFGGTAFGHTFPGVSGTAGIGDMTLCNPVTKDMSNPTTGLSRLMGGFWSGVSQTFGPPVKKRSSLDQARMQLLQQLLAAELNASAFGSQPSSGSFAAWEAAYCSTANNAATLIKNAQQQAASFNSQGDSSQFTPGTSADSKNARAIANLAYWDVLP